MSDALDTMMKTIRWFTLIVMLGLASGCATCCQNSDAHAALASAETPWWRECFGWLFDCAAESTFGYSQYQQDRQSGDPAR